MRYFLDTEFNGFDGELLSMALIRDNPELDSLYCILPAPKNLNPWVHENVLPLLFETPRAIRQTICGDGKSLAKKIEGFLKDDKDIEIVTDWPDDISYFCKAAITAPGEMITTFHTMRFRLVRVNSYPTTLAEAVQHNAWWDALALRQKLIDTNYWTDLAPTG